MRRHEGVSGGKDNTVQEQSSSIIVGGHALQQCKGIADPVRGCGSELRRVQEVVDRDDLLHQGGHDTYFAG